MSGIQSNAVDEREGAGAAEAKRPVIILSGGNSVQPLVARMNNKGQVLEPRLSEDFDIGILYPQVAEAMSKTELPVFHIDEGGTPQDQNDGLNWAALACVLYLKAVQRQRQNKVKACLPDGKIFKTVGDGLTDWMPGFVLSSCARLRTRLAVWRRLWDERDVRLVVTHEDVCEDTRSLVQLAKARGTPTLHIPHYNHGTGYGLPDVHDKLLCDWVAVTGEYMVEWYLARGVERDRIRVTGHPFWDRLVDFKRDQLWAKHALGLDSYRPVLTYATDWVLWTTLGYKAETAQDGWATVLDAYKGLQRHGWQLLCKVHPNARITNDKWHADIAQENRIPCAVTSRHLEVVLQATDILVCNGFSNVVSEAAMAGVPSISMGLGYVDEPACPNVPYDPQELYQAIGDVAKNKQVWEDELRPQFLERYVGPNDGKAAERVVEWCRELAGG